MSDKLKKFWAPMKEGFNKEHFIMNFMGALGIIPCGWISRELDNLWVGFGVLILWWALVVLFYLTYRYLKNK